MKKYYIDETEADYDAFIIALNSFEYRQTECTEEASRLSYGNPAYKIKSLKQKLSATDYQAIKYSEGFLSEAEYAEMKARRQAWREEINELEAQV